MNTERFRRVKEMFLRACELEPSARAVFLARECADDTELLAEVERLLSTDDGDFWEVASELPGPDGDADDPG